MQLPKLTPLQSRLLASFIASSILLIVLVSLEPHNFVYAAEIPLPPDHVQQSEWEQSVPLAVPITPSEKRGSTNEGQEDGGYTPDFTYFDRSLIGRQQEEVEKLTNNKIASKDVSPGKTMYFRFEKTEKSANTARNTPTEPLGTRGPGNLSERDTPVEVLTKEEGEEAGSGGGLRQRQSGRTVWLSANTCRQPSPNVTFITDAGPQLTLYVSSKNTKPGPSSKSDLLHDPIPFVGGYANFTLQTDSDLYVGISAPPLTKGWNGSWHFDVAASVDGYYHSYDNSSQFVYMIDTDSESALFITYNLSDSDHSSEVEKWRNMEKPFTMYTFPNDAWSNMTGLERSFCGLGQQFGTMNNITVDTSITTKFGDGIPRGQFHVQGLKMSKTYTGFLAMNGTTDGMELPLGGGTVRAGGQVFKQFSWTTKADDSCQVIFDLDFCSSVAYAVPSSSQFKEQDDALKKLYDDQARSYFQNFSNSLDQVACDTTSTAQYSLARTCQDCRDDYKSWLCSVLIPRCEDWSAKDSWLQERNINTPFANGTLAYSSNTTLEINNTRRNRLAYNQSRNTMIDDQIKPGPYKELLPCEDLCFDIVRSCPAQLQFACPNPPALALSYGKRKERNLTCNFPGAVVNLNQDRAAAGMLTASWTVAVMIAVLSAATTLI